jgi:VWFA-related protein
MGPLFKGERSRATTKSNLFLSKGILLFLFYIILCLLAAPSAYLIPAPQEAAQLEKPLQHEVSVALKLVQVYVTDKKGNPVLDLEKEDFALYDNGEQKTLTEFEKHILPLRSAETPAEERAGLTPIQASPPLLSRKFFLFFDFAYTNAEGARKIREAALNFIDTRLQPSDEVGVISYSAIKRLQIHEFMTTDHKKVRELVERFGLRDALGTVEDLRYKYNAALEAGGFADSTGEIKVWAMPSGGREALSFIKSLSAFAQALRYISGQKYLVFFSGGIPGPALRSLELRDKYEDLLKELATSNVVVYALKANPITETPEQMTGAPTLQKMADATGGRYFANIFGYEQHAEKIQNLTGSYYVLGYYIDERWDGLYHKIKVKINRPGCEVSAQAGYFNPKPFSEYSDLEKQLHLFDLALSDQPRLQTPVRFLMTALTCSPEKENNLCLIADIPVRKIKEIFGKKAEVLSLVFNAAGEIAGLKRIEEDFSQLTQESAFLYSFMSILPGAYKCRIIIRDLETGASAVASSTAIIPEQKEKGVQLLQPLLLRPEMRALYMKGDGIKNSVGKARLSSIADVFSIDTARYSPQVEKTLLRNTEVWAVVRCVVANCPAAGIKLSMFLFDKTKMEEIHIPLTIINEKEERDMKTYFIRFQVPEVEPDEYSFYLVAENQASGETSMVGSDFIIR